MECWQQFHSQFVEHIGFYNCYTADLVLFVLVFVLYNLVRVSMICTVAAGDSISKMAWTHQSIWFSASNDSIIGWVNRRSTSYFELVNHWAFCKFHLHEKNQMWHWTDWLWGDSIDCVASIFVYRIMNSHHKTKKKFVKWEMVRNSNSSRT